jgi:transcriptional regulator with XRE-family HTH domain
MDTAVEHRETSSQPSHLYDALSQRFGATVRQYRKQRRLTQRELAARIGLHYMSMSKIERGQRNIGVLLLLRLAHALDMPASSLLAPLETCTSFRAKGAEEVASSMPPSTQRDDPSLLQRLGAAIRQARQDQHLFQTALAAKTGLSFGYISEIELGQRNFSLLSLVRIADALGLSVAQLLQPVETHWNHFFSPTK